MINNQKHCLDLFRGPEVVFRREVEPPARSPSPLLAVAHVPLRRVEPRAEQDQLGVERSEGREQPPLDRLQEATGRGEGHNFSGGRGGARELIVWLVIVELVSWLDGWFIVWLVIVDLFGWLEWLGIGWLVGYN